MIKEHFNDERDLIYKLQKAAGAEPAAEGTKRSFFQCACGLSVEIDLSFGPCELDFTCPDLRCGMMYDFRYIGRRHEPDLRLLPGGSGESE